MTQTLTFEFLPVAVCVEDLFALGSNTELGENLSEEKRWNIYRETKKQERKCISEQSTSNQKRRPIQMKKYQETKFPEFATAPLMAKNLNYRVLVLWGSGTRKGK